MFFLARIRLPNAANAAGAWQESSRYIDRAGVIALWVHIAVSYWLFHDWSYADSVQHVADRTEEATGIATGVGIYANFLAAVLWTLVAFTTVSATPASAWRLTIEIYLWLMFINASIIFADRWSAVFFSAMAACTLTTIACQSNLRSDKS